MSSEDKTKYEIVDTEGSIENDEPELSNVENRRDITSQAEARFSKPRTQSSNDNSRFSQMTVTPNVRNETPRREPLSSIQNRFNNPIQSVSYTTANDLSENLEYIPQPSTSQLSNVVSYTPTPVHRDYVLITSPENDTCDTLFSLGDGDEEN
ncbi:unnamed protein product [Spodoptera exigua]|nr:unnamed protein product [Spodoptera exigua]